jgi:hypothetical protein
VESKYRNTGGYPAFPGKEGRKYQERKTSFKKKRAKIYPHAKIPAFQKF